MICQGKRRHSGAHPHLALALKLLSQPHKVTVASAHLGVLQLEDRQVRLFWVIYQHNGPREEGPVNVRAQMESEQGTTERRRRHTRT